MRKLLYNACIVCASCLLLFPCRVSANESTAIFEEVTDGTSNLDLELSSQTLTDTSSSNEITVEGNLPEGAKVSVTELNTEDYLSVLAEYYNTSVENVFCVSALDITIETVDGEEFQPKDYNETVTVTIQDVETTENDKEVIHIEETSLDSVSTMLAENTYTEFETDSFSVYLIGGVSYDTSDAEFLDNYFASAYLFSDGRLLVTAFKNNGMYTKYPWYVKKNSIKTVSFADSVTTIGTNAFFNYSRLTGDLIIPNSVTAVGDSAFGKCSGFTGNLVIPNSVTTIGKSAFDGCSGFTGDLIIPDSVTTIGEKAFYNCFGFNGTLALSSSMTSIGNSAFWSCSGFTGDLIIPDSVTTIGEKAFNGCSGLTGDLIIPDSVTSIGNYAFYKCSGFTGNLVIPNSVTTIGKGVFNDCSGFTGDLVIPDSVTAIGESAFDGCSGFTGDLIIPDSVTSIGNYAFWSCSGLTGDLVIPDFVTTIGAYTFSWCSGLTGDLIIPDSVTTIGNSAFHKCSGFTGNLVIPNSVTTIGKSAFNGCSGLTNITIGTNVTSIGNNAFYVPTETVTTLNTQNEVALNYDWAGDMRDIQLGSKKYTLNTEGTLFGYLDDANILHVNGTGTNLDIKLKDVLGSDADKVTGIVFDTNTIEAIGDEWCHTYDEEAEEPHTLLPNLSGNLVLPNSVKTIGYQAFQGCSGFTGDLIIPDSVTKVGKYAFQDCSGFNGKLKLSNSMSTIYGRSFSGCTGLTGDLVIPNSVKAIQYCAFSSCTGFVGSLSIPNSVTTIQEYAFDSCSNLTGSLTLPTALTTIGDAAFKNCSSFTGDLTIPKGVTSIGTEAFLYCSGLSGTLAVPNTVTSLGDRAFSNCSGFTKLYIGSGVTTIGTNCFLVNDSVDTKLFTKSTTVKDYDWSNDKRNVSAMNTFVIGLPQNITLTPTYLNSEESPVYYTSFNMEVKGDFEPGSYGEFEGVQSFTVSAESGDSRTVTANISGTRLDTNSTIIVPVVLQAPDPDLSQKFTGTLGISTTLTEVIPDVLAD